MRLFCVDTRQYCDYCSCTPEYTLRKLRNCPFVCRLHRLLGSYSKRSWWQRDLERYLKKTFAFLQSFFIIQSHYTPAKWALTIVESYRNQRFRSKRVKLNICGDMLEGKSWIIRPRLFTILYSDLLVILIIGSCWLLIIHNLLLRIYNSWFSKPKYSFYTFFYLILLFIDLASTPE